MRGMTQMTSVFPVYRGAINKRGSGVLDHRQVWAAAQRCPNRNPTPIRRGDGRTPEKRGKSVCAKHIAEHQKRPRIVGRFCFFRQRQKPVRMGDETGRAHPAERQKQRILRLHVIQNDGQPRRWIFRNAELLNLCWKFAKRRIAVAHALADVLRGGQRTGGFVRVKRAALQIRQKRQHAPRGFVRFQKIEHAAAASDEHRAPRQGMIDGQVKRFLRKLQNARAFVGAERNALGFRQVQRAEKRRRGQPKQRSKE